MVILLDAEDRSAVWIGVCVPAQEVGGRVFLWVILDKVVSDLLHTGATI